MGESNWIRIVFRVAINRCIILWWRDLKGQKFGNCDANHVLNNQWWVLARRIVWDS